MFRVARFLSVAVACFLLTAAVSVADSSSQIELSDLLKQDGRFDLEAATMIGFSGSLDLNGFALSFDPETGAPLFHPSPGGSRSSGDEFWAQL